MKKYARVADGLAVEIIELPKDWKLEDVYAPEVAETIHPAGAKVTEGWVFLDGEFSAPPPPPEPPYIPVSLPVDAFFERTTEAEADAIDEAMLAKPVKIRRAYQAATVLTEGTDLWAALAEALAELFTKGRAAELLQRP